MNKIGLFYGPQKGSVETIAFKIEKMLGADMVDLVPVNSASAKDVEAYTNIIFGISTIGSHVWARQTPSADWDNFLPELEKINYTNKVVALYGLGDSVTYTLHFVDSLGILGKKLLGLGANIVGRCPVTDYDFEDSEAVIDGEFIGLPLDEDFEPEKSETRIKSWLDGILSEFK